MATTAATMDPDILAAMSTVGAAARDSSERGPSAFLLEDGVCFFGRFVAVLRMFAALLAGANSMPAARFFFFNITGGVCWACLFGFGAYAVGGEIYKISGALSMISLGLFIAAGYLLSIFIRRNEVALRRRAEVALSGCSGG